MDEIWRDIEGYEGKYQISNLGRVKSLKQLYGGTYVYREKLITPIKQKYDDYHYVNLYKNGKQRHFKVHRLVAIHFLPNPKGKREINHINGCKSDNRAENLEWVTPKENMKHAYSVLKIRPQQSQLMPVAKLSLDGEVIEVFDSIQDAVRATGLLATGICACCRGKKKKCGGFRWEYVG